MGIEIVQHQPDDPGVGVRLVNQPAHLVSKVHSSAALGHFDVSPSALRFTEHEQVPGPVSLVLGVIAFHPSGLGFDGWPHVLDQLPGGLVETYHGTLWVAGFVVQVQHIPPSGATNSPLTLGMHHSFFFHGLSSFF